MTVPSLVNVVAILNSIFVIHVYMTYNMHRGVGVMALTSLAMGVSS